MALPLDWKFSASKILGRFWVYGRKLDFLFKEYHLIFLTTNFQIQGSQDILHPQRFINVAIHDPRTCLWNYKISCSADSIFTRERNPSFLYFFIGNLNTLCRGKLIHFYFLFCKENDMRQTIYKKVDRIKIRLILLYIADSCRKI